MNRVRILTTNLLCVLLLLLGNSGCANDAQRTRAQGAAVGSLLGSLAGAAIGYAGGGDDKSKRALQGALIGGGVGLIGGYAYGNHVANKKAQFAKKEDYLDACISAANAMNQQVYAYNGKLRDEIAQLKQQNATVLASYQANRRRNSTAKQQLNSQRQLLKSKHGEATQQLTRVNDEIAIQNTVLNRERAAQPAERIGTLEREVETLRTQKNNLEQSLNELASMETRMAV